MRLATRLRFRAIRTSLRVLDPSNASGAIHGRSMITAYP